MTKSAQGLDLDDDGMVKLCPVVGWTGFVPFGIACGLRIEFAPSLDRIETPEAIQLVLTPPQARELAALLLKKAEQATRKPETGDARH